MATVSPTLDDGKRGLSARHPVACLRARDPGPRRAGRIRIYPSSIGHSRQPVPGYPAPEPPAGTAHACTWKTPPFFSRGTRGHPGRPCSRPGAGRGPGMHPDELQLRAGQLYEQSPAGDACALRAAMHATRSSLRHYWRVLESMTQSNQGINRAAGRSQGQMTKPRPATNRQTMATIMPNTTINSAMPAESHKWKPRSRSSRARRTGAPAAIGRYQPGHTRPGTHRV